MSKGWPTGFKRCLYRPAPVWGKPPRTCMCPAVGSHNGKHYCEKHLATPQKTMKSQTGKLLESYRVTSGPMRSVASLGFNGKFVVPISGKEATVVCSDGMGWEHVSVSFPDRCLTWDEMCQIKALFWDMHEAVMQLHPPASEYINNHPYCLHLWRPTKTVIPMPPPSMVGLRALNREIEANYTSHKSTINSALHAKNDHISH